MVLKIKGRFKKKKKEKKARAQQILQELSAKRKGKNITDNLLESGKNYFVNIIIIIICID